MIARLQSLSDHVHPIVLRDVRQALRSRVYTISVLASCLAVTTIGILAVDRDTRSIELSIWTLTTSLRCLAPILLFAIPIQAFLSLRDEVADDTADQLILTSMSPFSVIAGMLLAALAQATVFLAFFAPMMAFSYMLLGVDTPTLLQCVLLSFFGCSVATSLAFAIIRLQSIRALREHVGLIAVFVLGGLTLTVVLRMDELVAEMQRVARSGEFGLGATQQAIVGTLATVFLALIGSGCLTKLRETRTVTHRLTGLVTAPAAVLLCGAGMEGGAWACLLMAVFWFPAVTEPLALNRRQRPLIPSESRQIRMMMPFLPGSGRAYLYLLVLAVAIAPTAVLTEVIFHGQLPDLRGALYLLSGIGYMLGLGGLCIYVRNHVLEESRLATGQARLRFPGLAMQAWVVAAILDGMMFSASKIAIFLLSITNPFFQLSGTRFAMPPELLAPAVLTMAAAAFVSIRKDVGWSIREIQLRGLDLPPRPNLSSRDMRRRRDRSRGR